MTGNICGLELYHNEHLPERKYRQFFCVVGRMSRNCYLTLNILVVSVFNAGYNVQVCSCDMTIIAVRPEFLCPFCI